MISKISLSIPGSEGGKENPLGIICILLYNTSFSATSEESFTSEEIANILETAVRRFSSALFIVKLDVIMKSTDINISAKGPFC